jgi:hypothetical protein
MFDIPGPFHRGRRHVLRRRSISFFTGTEVGLEVSTASSRSIAEAFTA